MWKRVVAIFFDYILIFFALIFISTTLTDSTPPLIRVVLMGLILIYEPIVYSLFGCTFGAYILKFRVRKSENPSEKINFLMAVIRLIVKILLGWISYLTLTSDPMRRAIHDQAAGSVVISV
jgi:uncharacterized RDD family membrane protein YckC